MPCSEPWGLAMRRRDFINAVAGAATIWPLSVRAQPRGKLPTIGFLGADESAFSPWTSAFVARLRELGWIEGRTIAIAYRWSQGRTESYAEIAAEFVRLNVDVIVTVGSAVPSVRGLPPPSQLFSRWESIQSAAAWSQVWLSRAATSLGYRSKRTNWPGSDWNSRVSLSLSCAGWQSCSTLAMPSPGSKWGRPRPPPAGSVLKLCHS